MSADAHVLTIGNFDGVHLGHGRLLEAARGIADGGGARGRVTALVFDPHPRAVLAPDSGPPARLTTFEQRRGLLLEGGADEVVRLEPTEELLGMEPEAFIERINREHGPTWMVEGHDFRFGRARRGDEHLLRSMGATLGFGLTIVDELAVALNDQHLVRASSSIVRWLVEHGRMADARRVLGRPYRLTGVVEPGDRRGREIGFPTANLNTRNAIPKDGVSAASAVLPGGRVFGCALHVGERPVFGDTRRTVEGYILDWDGPLAEGRWGGEEYGWPLGIDVHAYIRDQMGFSSVGGLVEQIGRDVARTRETLARRGIERTQPRETIA